MASVLTRPDFAVEDRRPPRRRPRRTWPVALAIVLLIGAFSLLFRLEDARSLGSHEGYAIIPAREMMDSGDYIVPRFGEMPRLKKPPLVYWSIIASATMAGELEIWSARLPAALAGLLLGGLMARWAWRWYGGVAAVGAAAAQLTSVYVLVFARKAEADMILVLLIAAALSLVVGHDPSESRRTTFLRWVGIWACAAISWMGKFHFAPAMIFAPAVAWLVLERRWRFLLGIVNPIGLLLFAAAAGIWPAFVLQRLPEAWAIWQEETIGRAVGELGHQPVWYFLPHLISWTLPWTIFAVLAWPASARDAWWPAGAAKLPRGGDGSKVARGLQTVRRYWDHLLAHGDRRERFLWIWLGVTFAMVSVSANKHPHYILPALPAFSLWTARRFAQLEAQARAGKRLLPWPLAVVLTAAAVAVFAVPLVAGDRLPQGLEAPTLLPVVGTAGIGLAITGWLLVVRRNGTAAAVAAVTWTIACGAALAWMMPAQDHRRGAYRFAEDVRARYGDGVEVGIFGIDQDAAIWYLGEPTFREESVEAIAKRLAATPYLRLITTADHEAALSQLGDLRVVERFQDRPGLPTVELLHYQRMVLLELTARHVASGDPGDAANP